MWLHMLLAVAMFSDIMLHAGDANYYDIILEDRCSAGEGIDTVNR